MTAKELRTLTGLSQREFGMRYNIPKRTIESWEEGKREPPPWVLELLERVVMEDIKKDLS